LTLAAIDMDETDEKYASLVEARVQWMRFCRENATTIADSKPVMITVSSAIYSYLLQQVSVYQESLSGPDPRAGSSQTECSDGDDVYYRFGGGALCEMLKNRYKEIKNCPSTRRNLLSVEITLLQAINTKDKSSIPAYLVFRDKGYMYFPYSSFIPFLRDLDTLLKSVVNDEGFRKHGDELVKVH